MTASLHLNIVARTNGVGLDRDVDLVREVAEAAGHRVTVSHCRDTSPLFAILPQKTRFDANIFMERVFTRWIGAARTNILIPNQERFPKRHLSLLKKIDHILCKSHHAFEIFSKYHSSCHFSGFTSKDLHDPAVTHEDNSVLHLAGRSTLKGTEAILALWKKHPEWPSLLLIQHKDNAPESVPNNITLRTDYLSNEELNAIMNRHRIHLCPSLSEGWGHYIVEAMACEAVVITTDGPPMNELVTGDYGNLVKVAATEPRHLGTNFKVDEIDLERAVTSVLNAPPADLVSKGQKAREWFLSNDQKFRDSLPALLKSLCK